MLYQFIVTTYSFMELSTRINLPKPPFTLSYTDKLLLLGSCFADNIGQKLADSKFNVVVNPFGTLYNPSSIASALEILEGGRLYTSADLFLYQGLYHSFDHHSRFSASSEEACLQQINRQLAAVRKELAQVNTAVVTLGTSFIYQLKETGRVVANCHKLPEKYFSRRRYSVEEITAACSRIVCRLQSIRPDMRIIFTVSPIRHWKDGAHENQLSKATLLLAVNAIRQIYPNAVAYFPAYEIMMDELRDYRFYADDMLHPSPLAVEYIWERFSESFIDRDSREAMKEWDDVRKALNHRPFNPESEAYRKFIVQTLLKIERITKNFSSFDTENEIKALKSKLS